MSGRRRGQPDLDCHIGVPYSPVAKHLPSRGSGEVFLGGSSAGRHAIRDALVDPPAMGQNVLGRMAALVWWNGVERWH